MQSRNASSSDPSSASLPRMVRVPRGRTYRVLVKIAVLLLGAMALFLLIMEGDKVRPASILPYSVGHMITQTVEMVGVDAYAVQLGAFGLAENARMEAARYSYRGAAGYIHEENDIYRVLGALCATPQAARAFCAQLAAVEHMDAVVYPIQMKGVTLKVTADEGQIQALTAVLQALLDAEHEFNALATALDDDRMKIDEVAARCALQSAALEACRERFANCAVESTDPLVSDLLMCLDARRKAFAELSGEKYHSPLYLSAEIKYNEFAAVFERANLLRRLAAR